MRPELQPVKPIHFRVPIKADHVNTACGLRVFPGDGTTKAPEFVTCAACKAKLAEPARCEEVGKEPS